MATGSVPTAAPPAPVLGTFVQTSATFFVRPSEEDERAWREHIPLQVCDLESYIMLKLLAPQESAEVVIQSWVQVTEMLKGVEGRFMTRFLRQMRERG